MPNSPVNALDEGVASAPRSPVNYCPSASQSEYSVDRFRPAAASSQSIWSGAAESAVAGSIPEKG